MFGRLPTIPLDHLLGNIQDNWNTNFVEHQAKLLQKAHEIARAKTQIAAQKDKCRWDKKALSKPVQVGDKILLKKTTFKDRHKLENCFHKETYVVINMNEEKDVLQIKPLLGGKSKWVNREMVILDPRQEVEIPSTQEIKWPDFPQSETSESDSDSDNDEIYWEMLPNAPEPEQETPPSPPDQHAPPRSTRVTRGQHSNVHNLPPYLR